MLKDFFKFIPTADQARKETESKAEDKVTEFLYMIERQLKSEIKKGNRSFEVGVRFQPKQVVEKAIEVLTEKGYYVKYPTRQTIECSFSYGNCVEFSEWVDYDKLRISW